MTLKTHFLMRYYLLAISVLFLVGCSSGPEKEKEKEKEKDIYAWNYYMNYDELDEQTTFLSQVYSTSEINFDYPYENPSYFLEIKTTIPDRIKTFDEYLDYSSRTQTNLINIKCKSCPLYSFGEKDLKYKIDDNIPYPHTGYNAESDNDGLDKYAIVPFISSDGFVKDLGNGAKKLLIEISTNTKGNHNLKFNISGFDVLDVIKRNHFKEEEKQSEKIESQATKESQDDYLDTVEEGIVNEEGAVNEESNNADDDFYIIAEDIASTEEEAKRLAEILEYEGFEKTGYLWIPDYKSLSGAEFYSVYIGPFSTIEECASEVEKYRKTNPSAYGLLVSKSSSERVEIRGPGRITRK